jgi:UDP-4-amino-4,6-dideoxy-N-acetyl-beta-L-altrosamine transaminase
MADSIIPYGKQNITEEDIQAVVEVLRSEFLTQGPRVKEFENAFAEYVGAKYAVAVSNGTTALHLCTLALGVQPGDKVITTPITFVASANCVLYCGGDVDFADIDPRTYCLDLNKAEELLKKNPGVYKGIIPVDFAGYPISMDDYRALADKYNLWIIEDACHAPGATYQDRKGQFQKTGNCKYSDATVFSFHPVKHIACGEGGMITTNDPDLYQKLMLLRTHGITRDPAVLTKNDGGWYYEMQALGQNYRIPDMLCALGTSQLKRAGASLDRRHEITKRYDAELKSLPIELPFVEGTSSHAYHLYVIKTKKRKELYDYLKQNGIYCQVHYIPVHQQPYYIERYGKQSFPVADQFYDECLSLPVYQSMTVAEQDKVIQTIQKFFN